MSADLRALEELKARYCRLLDTKQWAEFRTLFTNDFLSDTTESGGPVVHGADAFVAFVSRTLGRSVTVHQVQQPELTITTPSAAQGIWAMRDVVRISPGVTMYGFGHYHETYEKDDAGWRIASSRLTRLRQHVDTPVLTLMVPPRLLRRTSALVQRRMVP